jgi:hypothetical protein
MSNPRSIIKGALRSLGRIGRGRDMSAEQASDGLEILNQLLASWKTENLLLPFRTTETLTYSASQTSYTIGSGGDLNTIRPSDIIDAYHTDGSNDYAMTEMSMEIYNNITNKVNGSFPSRYYYESTYPLGRLYFDYTPGTSLSLVLVSMKEITAFADLTTTINLPSEYDLCLKTNLAVQLAPDYGIKAPDEVIGTAIMTKQNIKRLNKVNRVSTMTNDISNSNSRYNINNG